MGYDLIEQTQDLRVKTIEEVTVRLGKPDSELSYTMANVPKDELHVGLYNYFPPDRPDTRDVAIKELWWKRGRYTVVVWFHQVGDRWIAFDKCHWKEGEAF